MAGVRVAIVGGSGYIGGEALRLMLGHPELTVVAITSARHAGTPVETVHPNLRSLTDLRFSHPDALNGVAEGASFDVIVLATPHGQTAAQLPRYQQLAPIVVDMSADFRLRDATTYERYYSQAHANPGMLPQFVTGLPELYRDQLAEASHISTPGCMATAAILALHPLATNNLIEHEVAVDGRTGSSGSGISAGSANIHAERSGAMRVFAPLGHRHEAEIAQATGRQILMTATGVEAVRGVQVLCRARLARGVGERDLRAAYRQAYATERFVRITAYKRGTYRYPEPKILHGYNFCDVGFAVDAQGEHVLAIAALDNLVKGGAGNAVQSLNVRFGWPEDTGLSFPGLHPA